MTATVFSPEIATIYVVRDREGNIREHYVQPGSRIGIPDDLEIVNEIPDAPDRTERQPYG